MSTENIVTVEMKDGTEKKAYVRKPSRNAISSADMHRAMIWSVCINKGLMTKSQLETKMEELGIWTSEQEKEREALIEKLTDLEKKLYLTEGERTVKEGIDTFFEMKDIRAKITKLGMQRANMEENSADAIADNARFDYLVSECAYNEDNTQRLYSDIDDYNAQGNDEFAFAVAAKLAEMMYEYNEDAEKQLPEYQWLEQMKLVDEDGRLIDEDGNTVDVEGRRVNDKGQYVNEKGQITDKDGNLLDDNGNYIMKTEYKRPTQRKRRGRQPKAAKEDSSGD